MKHEFAKYGDLRFAELDPSDTGGMERFVNMYIAAHIEQPKFLGDIDVEETSKAHWRAGMTRGCYHVLQVLDGADKLQGFRFWWKAKDSARFAKLYILPEQRGRHGDLPYSIGTALNLKNLFDVAAAGVKSINGAVHAKNTRTLDTLVRKLGFTAEPMNYKTHLRDVHLTVGGKIPVLESLGIKEYWPHPVV